ncbi:MAG: hypothetical protein ACLURH_02570 [Bifidobacterium angulatum]
MKKIDEKMPQYKFKYTALAQDALLTGLQSGKYDVATCSFYGTAERFKTLKIWLRRCSACSVGGGSVNSFRS